MYIHPNNLSRHFVVIYERHNLGYATTLQMRVDYVSSQTK